MRRSIVFLDLDGTLSDSMPDLVALFVRLLAKHFEVPAARSREQVPELLKLPRPEQMAGFAELTGTDFSPENERVMEYRAELHAGQGASPLTLFPEAANVLRLLWERGYRLVLTTNAPLHSLDARLVAANIRDYFALVLGTDLPSGMTKGPDHFRRAGLAFDLTADDLAHQAVLVGDAEGDMSIAKTAGCVAIGRLTDRNGPEMRAAGADYLIDDLLGLEPVLAQLPQ
jgi:phosphoglycolate phosphatase-like HAD superfamily hydrolase